LGVVRRTRPPSSPRSRWMSKVIRCGPSLRNCQASRARRLPPARRTGVLRFASLGLLFPGAAEAKVKTKRRLRLSRRHPDLHNQNHLSRVLVVPPAQQFCMCLCVLRREAERYCQRCPRLIKIPRWLSLPVIFLILIHATDLTYSPQACQRLGQGSAACARVRDEGDDEWKRRKARG
jgi:hypothetical protein